MRARVCVVYACVACAIMTSGCRSDVVAAALADAEARWRAQGPTHYRMTAEMTCDCAAEAQLPVIVEVAADEVVEAVRVYADGTRSALPQEAYAPYFTVAGQFAILEEAAARAEGIEATFAPSGYPRAIRIDWVSETDGDEVGYDTSELQGL